MKSDQSSCERLPESVRQVAEVIGEEAALTLVRMWPRTATPNGTSPFRVVVYVPAKLTPDHRLVTVLGYPKAEQLVRIFGGDMLFLAECTRLTRDARDEAIKAALSNNASPATIALMVGVTERRVRQIAARIRAEAHAMAMAVRAADYARNSERATA